MRNPIVTWLMLCIPIYGLIVFIQLMTELKNFTQDQSFFAFGFLIPCYNMYWMLFVVPQQITKAKQMAGLQKPASSIFLYWMVFPYALVSDMNEFAAPEGAAAGQLGMPPGPGAPGGF